MTPDGAVFASKRTVLPSKRVTLSQVVKAMGRANHMHVRQLARLFELFEHHRNGPPRRKVAP